MWHARERALLAGRDAGPTVGRCCHRCGRGRKARGRRAIIHLSLFAYAGGRPDFPILGAAEVGTMGAGVGSLGPEGPTVRSITDLWWPMLALGAAVFPANA